MHRLERTSLLGRRAMVDQVQRTLRAESGSLLTLAGVGGVGKTRVALAAIRPLSDRFPDGIHFVDLGGVDDVGRLLPAIADAVTDNDRARGDGTVLSRAAGQLTGRQLLVLDGFDLVGAAAPSVSALLDHCPGLSILVTNRWPLHMTAERVIHLPGLSFPPVGATLSIAELSEYTAVQLYVERAQAHRPEFILQPDNAPAVAEICRRLDGLPLAIELAAALVQFLEPPALLAQAGHWLAVLTGGARDGPDHQRSLRSSIDRSYQLLAPAEQSMFRRVAVFTGGFSIPAAAAAAGVTIGPAFHTLAAWSRRTCCNGRPVARRRSRSARCGVNMPKSS